MKTDKLIPSKIFEHFSQELNRSAKWRDAIEVCLLWDARKNILSYDETLKSSKKKRFNEKPWVRYSLPENYERKNFFVFDCQFRRMSLPKAKQTWKCFLQVTNSKSDEVSSKNDRHFDCQTIVSNSLEVQSK